jgi:hypothetical protein
MQKTSIEEYSVCVRVCKEREIETGTGMRITFLLYFGSETDLLLLFFGGGKSS